MIDAGGRPGAGPGVGGDDDGSELVYRLYQQGHARLSAGNPAGAVEVLELAIEREPRQASLREALGRAYFATAHVESARAQFAEVVDLEPANDYAHFGLGRCLERQGRLSDAAKHLKLACALGDAPHYERALARVRARLSAGRAR